MSSTTHPQAAAVVTAEHPVAVAGRLLVRYGLVVVIAWIGALKYTTYEAVAIQPLVAHSPLLSWVYQIFSVRTFAAVLGTAEITAALLIALRPLAPRVSVPGSALAVLLFLGTLSFLLTTPGVTAAGGFPVLSVLPGQFLLKDLVLAAAALWTLGDALGAARSHARSAVRAHDGGSRRIDVPRLAASRRGGS
jgi:reactive chlorine resistance protein C